MTTAPVSSTLELSTLKINADRLNGTIHETATFGAALRFGPGPTETGMARLALDDNDALVRQYFVKEAKELGCKVTVDQLGNIFAVRPGRRAGAPTAMGSHLDTQPTGGRYDGILGVLSGLEVLRTIHEANLTTEFPIAVIDWTNEEGARFPKSVVSSGVWAGELELEEAWSLADINDPSKTMKSELARIGFLGETPCSYEAMPLGAHFELHIEQGPILEQSSKLVGVVLGAQAYRWYTVDVYGRDCHTGSTPFGARSDAMLCAAQCIVASNKLAKEFGALASTGILTLEPGSTNVCPSHVRFSLDIRHPSTAELHRLCDALQEEMTRIGSKECEIGCKVRTTLDRDSAAAVFHDDAIIAVRASAASATSADKIEEMYSGAAHDSCPVSMRVPTAMIFVPSKDGVSHNPVEYTSPEECALGAQVLLHAVLNYDKMRTA
ncbi:hypothetical protein BCR35DRAFT_341113 [Leucosporidium creatinivorum]|uniref:Peptidase M20 dimerisation domain-containing protein n=1 Tax=Leucosporidium creatinivorum TaxID=106004 RepID=A0A1Y2FDQ7_9BASI|nr:hypothetical protein BCR35DRAFT_341113 [Leucosporidium creatinivorum]